MLYETYYKGTWPALCYDLLEICITKTRDTLEYQLNQPITILIKDHVCSYIYIYTHTHTQTLYAERFQINDSIFWAQWDTKSTRGVLTPLQAPVATVQGLCALLILAKVSIVSQKP